MGLHFDGEDEGGRGPIHFDHAHVMEGGQQWHMMRQRTEKPVMATDDWRLGMTPPSPLVGRLGRKVGEAAWADEGVFMEKWSSLTSCTGPN
jgi:hypothetical protein